MNIRRKMLSRILLAVILAVGVYCEDLQFVADKTDDYKIYEDEIEAHSEKLKTIYSPPEFHECENRPDDEDNCGVICDIAKPYKIIYGPNQYYVVQGSNFVQKIGVTKCRKEYSPCFKTWFGNDETKKCECQTTTTKMSVYVYNPVTKIPEPKLFEVPTCCKCVIRDNIDYEYNNY